MRRITLAAALIMLGATVARADQFVFSYANIADGFTASGTLTASPNGDGTDTATGATGATDVDTTNSTYSGALTFVANSNAPTGSSKFGSYYSYDDQLFPLEASSLLDKGGLLFTLGNGDYLNIYLDDGYNSLITNSFGEYFESSYGGSFTLVAVPAAVPEPSSLLMTGAMGLAAAVGCRRARRARAAA